MIIDTHEHVVCPPERQIHLLNEAGIDCAVLFSTTVHPERFSDLPGTASELGKLYDMMQGSTNPLEARIRSIKELSHAVCTAPSRYHAFGPVPLGLPDDQCREWIKTYIVPNHFIGLGEFLPPPGHAEILEPLFRISQEFGTLPLWIHTFHPLGWEDISTILSLSSQYPSTPVILGHLGGSSWMKVLQEVRDMPQVYLDLSALFTTMALTLAVHTYPERTLFSSDAPYGRPLSCLTVLRQNITDPEIFRKVTCENVVRLLNLS